MSSSRLVCRRCRTPAKAGVPDPTALANFWRCPKCGAVEDSAFAEREVGRYLRIGGKRSGLKPPRFVYE